MKEEMVNQLLSMFSNVEDKKLNESVNKAIDILKTQNIDEIKNSIINQDFSAIPGFPKNANLDLGKIIDSLPEDKKKALVETFNSSKVQTALKKDKNKAIQMLLQSVIE